jgi:hypothetical protein
MDLYAERAVTVPAGGVETVYFVGANVRLMEASGAVRVLIDGRKAENLRVGIELPVPEGFDRVQFQNDGAADVDLVVAFSAAGVRDDRISVNGNITLGSDTGLSSTADESVAATTTELVLAANGDRRAAVLKNPATNSDRFRVGDANTGATQGISLEPGEGVTLETSAAIYAYNAGASAQDIELLEIER